MGVIYFDSCAVIYAVEEHPVWGERARAALPRDPRNRSAISSLVKLECLVRPFKHGDHALEARFVEFFTKFDQLDMPEAVYLRASALRARFGLKTPDALHLACAQHHRCEAFLTNDNRLDRASNGLARNVFG